MSNRGTGPDSEPILPELSSLVRADKARTEGNDTSVDLYDMLVRLNANRERNRLRRFLPKGGDEIQSPED